MNYTSPVGLLDKLTPAWMNGTFWALVILAYYLLATLLPMDKLIGRLYPIFGVLLIVMAGAVIGGILFSGGKYVIPEISLKIFTLTAHRFGHICSLRLPAAPCQDSTPPNPL